MNDHQSPSRTCGFGFIFAVANETYPLMRTIPSLKEKTMFAGISAIAIAIVALAGEYYVVALTQEH
jgi:hypothetical protein